MNVEQMKIKFVGSLTVQALQPKVKVEEQDKKDKGCCSSIGSCKIS